ncbi:hypothetical protein TNIN_383761 [Trichonephila inaurata madagascariensis]|uniref:Uncharacterized protein n=1 Tax=Trichonephila inaurata madagascariensis TaxID=2747483 RepID=A0A8X6XAH6_9ARAC|nr:hypothetical protein TNIN_383761 [Trichonephila inaurata madagascariensis]
MSTFCVEVGKGRLPTIKTKISNCREEVKSKFGGITVFGGASSRGDALPASLVLNLQNHWIQLGWGQTPAGVRSLGSGRRAKKEMMTNLDGEDGMMIVIIVSIWGQINSVIISGGHILVQVKRFESRIGKHYVNRLGSRSLAGVRSSKSYVSTPRWSN